MAILQSCVPGVDDRLSSSKVRESVLDDLELVANLLALLLFN